MLCTAPSETQSCQEVTYHWKCLQSTSTSFHIIPAMSTTVITFHQLAFTVLAHEAGIKHIHYRVPFSFTKQQRFERSFDCCKTPFRISHLGDDTNGCLGAETLGGRFRTGSKNDICDGFYMASFNRRSGRDLVGSFTVMNP